MRGDYDSVGGNGGEALRGEKIGMKRDIRDLSRAFNECTTFTMPDQQCVSNRHTLNIH